MAQVLEPHLWNIESVQTQPVSKTDVRPNDAMALKLYQSFTEADNNKDAMELLLASAKSPFVEERLGAYTLFKALVDNAWSNLTINAATQ